MLQGQHDLGVAIAGEVAERQVVRATQVEDWLAAHVVGGPAEQVDRTRGASGVEEDEQAGVGRGGPGAREHVQRDKIGAAITIHVALDGAQNAGAGRQILGWIDVERARSGALGQRERPQQHEQQREQAADHA